jgi:hypothetical protein
MFMKSKGRPIVYEGKTLVMTHDFPTEGAKRMRLVFESCNAEWRQGASLRVRSEGKIVINGQQLTHAVCWQDTAPETVEFEISGKVPNIEIKNVWDVGNGVMESWHNGAAMIVETLPTGRRYRCNDGFPDDDFDDIVFRLERLG